jgi:hypothetical protein
MEYEKVETLDLGRMDTWDAEQVTKFFDSMQLSQDYSDLIQRHGIDGRVLDTVLWAGSSPATVLKDLGVVDVADALKVCHALRVAASAVDTRRPMHRVLHPRSAAPVTNPLLVPVNKTSTTSDDGFKQSQVEGQSETIFFDNPTLDIVDEGGSVKQGKQQQLRPPRWSVAALDEGLDNTNEDCAEEDSWLAVLVNTFHSWFAHFKLMGLALVYAIYFEICMWLFEGELTIVFLFLAYLPYPPLNAGLLTAVFGLLSSKCEESKRLPYADYKKWALRIGIIHLFAWTFAFCFTASKKNWQAERHKPIARVKVLNYGGLWVHWVGMYVLYPGAMLYVHRKAFRWNMGAYSLLFIVCSSSLAWRLLLAVGRGTDVLWNEEDGHFTGLYELYEIGLQVFLLTLLGLAFKTAVWDSARSACKGISIRGNGGYVAYLLAMILWLPWMLGGLLKTLFDMLGDSPLGTVGVLIIWSLFLVVVYLQARLCAKRCAPYTAIPILVLPLQMIGDLFTEIIFMNFSLTEWTFWVVMVSGCRQQTHTTSDLHCQ